jgi:hypothetical protein
MRDALPCNAEAVEWKVCGIEIGLKIRIFMGEPTGDILIDKYFTIWIIQIPILNCHFGFTPPKKIVDKLDGL